MTSPPLPPFGQLLKRHRIAAGLTQEALAERARLAARTISDLERGLRPFPYRDTITKLARALQLSEAEAAQLQAAAQRHGAPRLPPADAAPAAHAGGADAPVGDHQRMGPGSALALARQLGEPVEPSAEMAPPSAGQLRVVPFPRVATDNLPTPPTPLIGRDQEVEAVCALLRAPAVRLLTVTGTAGVGKTRLALAVAAELVDEVADGVWFVRLSRLADPGLVLSTIAQTLGVTDQSGRPLLATLCASLRDKRLLLVLDNFEHVLGAASEVSALLSATTGLQIVVTSRTPLRLRGERAYPLDPLPTPDPARLPPRDELTRYAAVALFVARACDVQPSFALIAANAPTIAAICARLEGLPLAIELAAARVRLLPPEALLARLSSQLKLLTGGARDAEERQRTMRATLAWSEALLTAEEQTLFQRLAVFAGGATLEAAEAVCAAPAGVEPLGLEVLEGLGRLVDHSLVQRRIEEAERREGSASGDGVAGGSEPHIGMLHVIREYALERLEASDGGREAEALRQAHAAYFLALAERAEPELRGPEAAIWLERLEREHDNLRAALGWAQTRGDRGVETGLRLVGALGWFWWARGHLREGRAWAEGLLAQDVGQRPGSEAEAQAEEVAGIADTAHTGAGAEAAIRARALLAGGHLVVSLGEHATAQTWLEQAAALGRATGDRHTTARALNSLGLLAGQLGDSERAAARFAESLALNRALENRRGVAVALNNLGDVAVYQGDLERATVAFTEALALAREMGDRDHTAMCLQNLGTVARKRGEVAQAEALQREALALFQALGEPHHCAEALEYLGSTAGAAGQGERAARLLGAAAAVRQTLGTPLPAFERAEMDEAVAVARADLGEPRWEAAFAAGQALALEQAIAEALDSSRVPRPARHDQRADRHGRQ
jgi:predicted ATPase/transcriptional regulator with XRE-family HTH domain/Tfp pilus assembly protein PilF